MHFWLSKNSEVPVREQIITQITLGITSGDLAVGEKVPSTQEIARRFQIHSNTVSNAYQKLAADGWIEFRKGSGFFVCEIPFEDNSEEVGLETLITGFVKKARAAGFSGPEIRAGLEKWFSDKTPGSFLVIDSDEGLREILVEEIRQTIGLGVRGASFADLQDGLEDFFAEDPGLILTAMNDEMPKIQSVLPPGKNCIYLQARSVSEAMAGQPRPGKEDLIGLVSGWDKFLFLAKTMLLAARIESDSLIVRSTAERGWRKGLNQTALIICDALTEREFPKDDGRVRTFRLINDDSLEELRESIQSPPND